MNDDPLKMNKYTELLFDSLHELYGMESQVATSLPVLSGSVMNVRLRKLLTDRAFRTRDRRDWLAGQLIQHGVPPDCRRCAAIRGILTAGNEDLERAGNPFSRDLVMVRHCLRIEQHATAAYGIVSPLAESAGFPTEVDRLAGFLSELKVACMRLQAIESELSRNANYHRSRSDRMSGRADHAVEGLTKTAR